MSVTAINPTSGGMPPKQAASSSNDLAKLKMLVNEHMSISQIATRLGKSVSAIRQEAAMAGLTISAGSTSNSPAATTANPAVGNNVNVKV